MREDRDVGASMRDILHMGLSGLVAGGFAGLAEFLFRRATEGHQFPTSDLLPYMLFYGLIWAAFALALTLVLAAFSRLRARPSSWVRTAGSSIVVASVPAGLIGSYVNGKFLPGMLAASSLLFDALVLIAGAVAAVCIFRAVERRRRAGAPRVWLKSPLGVATVLWICLLVIASVVPASDETPAVAPAGEASGDLNILLLLVDALRADHLGCYGYDRDTSPNLDELAEEGLFFENAYTQAPVTKASTASLVTSLYPSSHRVRGITDALPEDTPVLMEEMRKLGYRTALLSANAFLSPLFGFDRGVDYSFTGDLGLTRKAMMGGILRQLSQRLGPLGWLESAVDRLDRGLPRSGRPLSPYEEHAGRLNANLLSWIDARPDAPFFAYVHYMEPHMPLAAPAPYDTMFDGRPAAPRDLDFPRAEPGVLPFAEAPALPEEELSRLVAQYDATIAYFDAELKKLLEALEERGLLSNTLIVVTADHGEAFHEHGAWGHGNSVFEEAIRVPLIVWCPPRLAATGRREETVRLIDLMPTLLAATGCDAAAHWAELEGVNLWPALSSGAEFTGDLPVFSEQGVVPDVTRALRVGDMKMVCSESGDRRVMFLFDLASDPGEVSDLSEIRPELSDTLYAQMVRMREEAERKQTISQEREIDEATRETLRALGYVN